MVRRTKLVRWHELGFWTTDEDGRNVEWHVIGRYEDAGVASRDRDKAQEFWQQSTLMVRTKLIEIIVE